MFFVREIMMKRKRPVTLITDYKYMYIRIDLFLSRHVRSHTKILINVLTYYGKLRWN